MIRNSLFDTLRRCDFFLDEMDVEPRRPSSPGSSLCNPLPRCHSLSVRFPGAAGYLLDHNKVLLMIDDEQESVVAVRENDMQLLALLRAEIMETVEKVSPEVSRDTLVAALALVTERLLADGESERAARAGVHA